MLKRIGHYGSKKHLNSMHVIFVILCLKNSFELKSECLESIYAQLVNSCLFNSFEMK